MRQDIEGNFGDRVSCGIAFTLVEMLVVISIVAILSSLLLPVLKGARETAKSIQCMNNLKQWNLCCVNYVNDSNGFFPPWQLPIGGGLYQYPLFIGDAAIMKDYMLTKPGWIYYQADTSFYLANKAKANLLSCPAALIPKSFGMDYGQNCFLGAAAAQQAAYKCNTAPLNRSFFKIYRIPFPSRVMFWGDAWNFYLYTPELSCDAGAVRYPHKDSANLLYVDGHVDNCKYSLPNTPAETATQWEPWL